MAKYEVNDSVDKVDLDGESDKCPYCGETDNLDYEGPDVQEGMVFYNVHCMNDECENDYQEWHTLTFDCNHGYPIKIKSKYRVLIELDTDGNQMESVGVLNVDTYKVEHWCGNSIDAFEWVEENGELAITSNNEEE